MASLTALTAFSGFCNSVVVGQTGGGQLRHSPTAFPELIFTNIPGAPKLSTPTLIMGATGPVLGEGMGWASPAFFDENEDGKKDLLIGEFGSRLEDNGLAVGNFVRVYKNLGTTSDPKFNDYYDYLRPGQGYSNGTPISVGTWCCLGFTPRIIDLDQDGFDDIVSGQFDPGLVTWFRGSKKGFHEGVRLPQFGDDMLGLKSYDPDRPWTDPDNWGYWAYTSADLGDLDGDGLPDLITGGGSLRISKNIGTKSEPSFARRELLLDTAGHPLTIMAVPDTIIKPGNLWRTPYYGGAMIPFVTDWDGDGVLDLLVSNKYATSGSQTITFFRGVETDRVQRFIPGVPLFVAKDGGKAIPGSYLHICVADYNGDGVNDLLIGTSVAIRDSRFNPELAWGWEVETESLGIYAAHYSEQNRQQFQQYLKDAASDPKRYQQTLRKFYGKPEYENLAHQGYVYVMIGKK